MFPLSFLSFLSNLKFKSVSIPGLDTSSHGEMGNFTHSAHFWPAAYCPELGSRGSGDRGWRGQGPRFPDTHRVEQWRDRLVTAGGRMLPAGCLRLVSESLPSVTPVAVHCGDVPSARRAQANPFSRGTYCILYVFQWSWIFLAVLTYQEHS